MSERQAICIVVDGLRASALGTYGNTTSATPTLDKLAGRSTVVEWLWADSPQLAGFYRAIWSGAHTLRKEPCSLSILELLGEAGITRRLITDDSELEEQPTADRFDNVVCVETAADFLAEDISDTAIGQFCSAAIERLEEWQEESAGGLTWLHTRGLFNAWDAPVELRAEQLDEEDPPPPDFLIPPALINTDDPDVLLVHRAAYAAQIAVVDACVGALCHAIEELTAGTETLLMLLGSRGFALGEHGGIGGDCSQLYGERLHLPWLLHVCGQKIPRPRLAGLAHPTDIGATLLDWFKVYPNEANDGRSVLGSSEFHQLAVAVGESQERAIRSPAWLMRQTTADEQPQLFVKPDDRWEANDIAVRCPQIIERLREVLDDFENRCTNGRAIADLALDQELINPSR